ATGPVDYGARQQHAGAHARAEPERNRAWAEPERNRAWGARTESERNRPQQERPDAEPRQRPDAEPRPEPRAAQRTERGPARLDAEHDPARLHYEPGFRVVEHGAADQDPRDGDQGRQRQSGLERGLQRQRRHRSTALGASRYRPVDDRRDSSGL